MVFLRASGICCTPFLTPLYHQVTLGHREEEEEGGKLWLILL